MAKSSSKSSEQGTAVSRERLTLYPGSFLRSSASQWRWRSEEKTLGTRLGKALHQSEMQNLD